MKAKAIHVKMTYKELSTVLAALRLWQEDCVEAGDIPGRFNVYFEDTPPLTSDEIDVLVQKLNC